jgi:ABC-2 type transport system ATP-binding protein
MAVLASGSILLEGNPQDLVSGLQGKIWQRTVTQQEAADLEARLPVISKRLFAGRTVLNVLSDTCPEGFEATDAGLEDLYFSTLHSHRSQAA